MEKRTKKVSYSKKKQKQERVLNYMMELKAEPRKVLDESERLIMEISNERQTNANNNLNELQEQYEAVLNIVEDEGLNRHKIPNSAPFKYYPDYANDEFNDLIFKKKEF